MQSELFKWRSDLNTYCFLMRIKDGVLLSDLYDFSLTINGKIAV